MAVPDPVVLVEGESDRRAIDVLAARRGRAPLAVTVMGGITNLGHHLDRLDRERPGQPVVLLHDRPEEAWVGRALARRDRPDRRLTVHVCDADLEDELIRALGVPRVLELVAAHGDLPAWHILRRQPFHRERDEVEVLRRFLGTTRGRKIAYAGHLAAALGPHEVPAPLAAVVAG